MLSCCFLDFFVGVGVYVIGLSQISSFFSFYCCIRRVSHLHYLYRFYHERTTHTWSVCNEMYHNVFRYEYLTFQTQIPFHNSYIFDNNNIQSEYAFLFSFQYIHIYFVDTEK